MTSVVGRFVASVSPAQARKTGGPRQAETGNPAAGRQGYFPPPSELKKLINRQGSRGRGATVTMTVETFNKLLEAAMASLPFDEEAYLERYPDVKAAVKAGRIRSAFHHFASNGYFEQWAALNFPVDEAWYTSTYPDVSDAVRSGAFTSGAHHFAQAGFFEGRAPSKQALADYSQWQDLIERFPAPQD